MVGVARGCQDSWLARCDGNITALAQATPKGHAGMAGRVVALSLRRDLIQSGTENYSPGQLPGAVINCELSAAKNG